QPGAGGRDVGREGRQLAALALDDPEVDRAAPRRARGCYDGERPASALAHARADSSVGRARPLQGRGPRFDPWSAYQKNFVGGISLEKINGANSLAIFVSESFPKSVDAVRGWK